MSPVLASLIALQQLDSAAAAATKRIEAVPGTEQAIDARLSVATSALAAAKAALHDNQTARRELEKEVALVESRMARFESHKAAVKTNQEYQALTHEIATAKTEKEAVEEKILVLMEAADELQAGVKAAEASLAAAKREAEVQRKTLHQDRTAAHAELERLAAERRAHTAQVDKASLANYEQLLKNRRGVAVAAMVNGICTACNVRLRLPVEQQVRRGDSLVHCDSCRRILYVASVPKTEDATA